MVDIIIPVFRGLEQTRNCIESVLSSNISLCRQIIVINDCSPEPALVDYCGSLSDVVNLLTNDTNLGFVASVNRAISESSGRDVILLNSDTLVPERWLDKLYRAAYSDESIGTVTPLSNNAEIASYPVFCGVNNLLPGLSLQDMDDLVERANKGIYIEAPTGVGFCLYIKRGCIDSIGLLNEKDFGRGYGEENDFCLRATDKGWKHIIAGDVFIYHEGGVSFGDEKQQHAALAIDAMQRLHRDYFNTIDLYIKNDPLRVLRSNIDQLVMSSCSIEAIEFLRDIRSNERNMSQVENNAFPVGVDVEQLKYLLKAVAQSTKPCLLFITHDWGGGVEQHIQDLLEILADEGSLIVLRGMGSGGVTIQVVSREESVSCSVGGFSEATYMSWVDFLQSLPVSRVHLHHIQGWPKCILQLITELNVPIDITAHDFFPVSPNYHLQEKGVSNDDPSWPRDSVKWREIFKSFLFSADRVIAPTQSVKAKLIDSYPDLSVIVKEHPQKIVTETGLVKIVLIGALSPEKGLDLVQDVVNLAASIAPQLAFTLVGYSSSPVSAPITITGSYAADELSRILALEKPDIIWFPAQVPETFSYTLSHAMLYGCTIVASNIGAFPERLDGYSSYRLLPATASSKEWVDQFLEFDVHDHYSVNRVCIDTTKDYKKFYTSPFVKKDIRDTASIKFNEFISVFKAVPEVKDTPIKYLYKFAVYGRNLEKIKEIERRLDQVGDDESEVVGKNELMALIHEHERIKEILSDKEVTINIMSEDFRVLRDELDASQAALMRSNDEIIHALSNIEILKGNITTLQVQANDARLHIDHIEGLVAEKDVNINELVRERDALLNSFSWKITRPLRVLVRFFRALPLISSRLFRHAFRPSSYRRLLGYVIRGQWRSLFGRASYEVNNAISESAIETKSIESVPVDALPSDESPMLPLVLNTSTQPVISIIIPVFGQHATTYACLKSIAKCPPEMDYEVVIADDCSPEPAEEALACIEGVRFVRNAENLGFVGNMNAGAKAARGCYLILLNNDTLVRPGALDAMINTFTEFSDVGLVGAKLLNQDGTLQEAGGIIWRDGSGWNWGRDENPENPRFNYVRDVDYCSGAALAIKAELFAELGGFDEYYKPAYYEDTDLAFRVREKGLRVLYQPRAEIYHLEGVTHGRDEKSGVKAYQVENASKFYARWKTTLSAHAENGDDPLAEANRNTKGNILVLEACMLTPDQDSGSIRMLNFLKILKDENYHVTFIADNLEYRAKSVKQLTALGVEVLHGQWAGSVRKVLRERGRQLQAAIICRHYIASQYVSLVRAYAPQAKLIFDTVDLHFVREEREAELSDNKMLKSEALVTRRKELGLIASSDLTIVVSEFEKQLLADLMPEAKVDIVSNIHAHTPQRPGYMGREGVIFVGGFRHTPNIDAIKWYAQEVIPHLQNLLPDVVTTVIGSNMPDEVKALASPTLIMRGFVEDIEPELQRARVSVAPLRYGAGVKGKVNEAMNYGIPVVATTCAVEGMYLTADEVMVADEPRAFAEAIAQVYQSQALWEQLSAAGVSNINAYFSPQAALPAIRRILD